MGVFSKKITAEDYGKFMRSLHQDLYSNALGIMKENLSRIDEPIPEELAFEVYSLFYFAFDFALQSIDNQQLANRIRLGFSINATLPQEAKTAISIRINSYVTRISQKANPPQEIGIAFSENIKTNNNLMVIMLATTLFTDAYNNVNSELLKNLYRII